MASVSKVIFKHSIDYMLMLSKLAAMDADAALRCVYNPPSDVYNCEYELKQVLL